MADRKLFLRKTLRGFLIAGVALVVLIAAFFGYHSVRSSRLQRETRQFCDAITVKQDVDQVLARARDNGMHWSGSDKERNAHVWDKDKEPTVPFQDGTVSIFSCVKFLCCNCDLKFSDHKISDTHFSCID